MAKARWGPVQVKITVQGRNHPLQAPSIDMVSRTTMTSGGYVQIAAARPRRGWHMSSTAVQGRTDRGIHRRVEHIIGMPISLAMRSPPHRHYQRSQTWRK